MNETLKQLKPGETLVLADDGTAFEYVERDSDGYTHFFSDGYFTEVSKYDGRFCRISTNGGELS